MKRIWVATAALLVLGLLASGCQQVPLARDRQKAAAPRSPTPAPTQPAQKPAGSAAAVPSSPFIITAVGEVSTSTIFSEPVLTLVFAVENALPQPQVLIRVDAVLLGTRGQQLGTRSWGSRPVVLNPGVKLPVAFSFEAAEWKNVNVVPQTYRADTSREAHTELRVTRSSFSSDGSGRAMASGLVENTGQKTAYDITVFLLGYDESGSIVVWGYGYPPASPLHSGRSAAFEVSRIQGDIAGMVKHQFVVFGQGTAGPGPG